MASEPKQRLTVQEYLAFERQSETKSEYLEGEVCAMTGASRKHILITGNVHGEIRAQLKGRDCEIYSNDMRIRTPTSSFYFYPDVAVACGEPKFEDSEFDTLLNPTLIVEVLSSSTEDYDRGTKFVRYRSIPSLSEYILIAQDRPYVEHWLRQTADQWLLIEIDDLEQTLEMPSIGCRLPLTEIYDRVFPA